VKKLNNLALGLQIKGDLYEVHRKALDLFHPGIPLKPLAPDN
jgi:hypothetical protein